MGTLDKWWQISEHVYLAVLIRDNKVMEGCNAVGHPLISGPIQLATLNEPEKLKSVLHCPSLWVIVSVSLAS